MDAPFIQKKMFDFIIGISIAFIQSLYYRVKKIRNNTDTN